MMSSPPLAVTRPPATRPPVTGNASQILAAWPADREFTCAAALDAHPELAGRRSILVDLAYEEFCRLEEQKTPVERHEFAARYPEIERSLRRVLDLHRFCWSDPDIRRAFFAGPWPVAGESILGYQLVEEIGRGAASRVFLAIDPDLSGRQVIVKVGRALDEAAALGRLEHPGIVPVLFARLDTDSGLSVLCMPYRGRGTLYDLIDRLHAATPPQSALDLLSAARSLAGETTEQPPASDNAGSFTDAVARFGAELAEALAFAHAQGIVHSDVKPSNVLVTAGGQPLLLDFNLARGVEADDRLVGGTLPYMAPEQLSAWAEHAGPIGPEADIYALGATLYELLTGKPPFGQIPDSDPAAAAVLLAERHRLGPQPITDGVRQGNRVLAEQIASCLSTDPKRRPAASELAAALRASLPRKAARPRWLVPSLVAGTVLATSAASWLVLAGPLSPGTSGHTLNDPDALARRGWQRLSAGQMDLALADLEAAYTREPTSQNAAALGYCILRHYEDWRTAASLFEQAIANGGDTPEVRNAAGYCYLKLSLLEPAEAHLKSALALDSSFDASRWNLVRLEVDRSHKFRRPPDLSLVRSALAKKVSSPIRLLDAAGIFALACAMGEDCKQELVQTCSEAIEAGLNPKHLNTIATVYPAISDDSRFRELTLGPEPLSSTIDPLLEKVPPPFPLAHDPRALEFAFAGR